MERQPFAAVQDHVLGRVERDPGRTGQGQQAALADARDEGRGGGRVDQLGLLTGQAEHHGLDAAVAVAGGAERPEQLSPQRRRPVRQPVIAQ